MDKKFLEDILVDNDNDVSTTFNDLSINFEQTKHQGRKDKSFIGL